MYSWEMTEGSSIKWRQLKPEEMYCLGGGQWLTRVCSEHHNRTVQSSCHDRVCLLYQEKNECLSQTEFPVCVPDNSWPEPGRSLTVFLLFVFLFLHTSSEFLSHALQVIGCSQLLFPSLKAQFLWLTRQATSTEPSRRQSYKKHDATPGKYQRWSLNYLQVAQSDYSTRTAAVGWDFGGFFYYVWAPGSSRGGNM